MDCNQIIDRRGTDCLKYDFAAERGRPADVLPLWVADMDFPVAKPIREALEKRVLHGIFGYTDTKADYFEAVAGWFSKYHGWTPKPDWLLKTPGVVFALAMAVKAYTAPGDGVLVQPPVYYPFHEVVRDNDRKLVENKLLCKNGRYEMDFADLAQSLRTKNVKMMLLCSPHNPVGRVWTKEELEHVLMLCDKYGVVLVVDEIHCDFTFPGHPFTAAASLREQIRNRLVICTAPSKTFNIAGLQVSNIFIPDAGLRSKFKHQIDAAGYSQLNTLGLLAAKTAYQEGAPWLDEVRAYLLENLNFLRAYLQENIPQIKLIEPDGTYLLWLDFAALGLSGEELDAFITTKAHLWLDGGKLFGGGSEQYQRINIACPRAVLLRALEQLSKAVRELIHNR